MQLLSHFNRPANIVKKLRGVRDILANTGMAAIGAGIRTWRELQIRHPPRPLEDIHSLESNAAGGRGNFSAPHSRQSRMFSRVCPKARR
jgi:hypothetical protein